MKVRLTIEPQVQLTFNQLNPSLQEQVKDCFHILRLGKPVFNETPLKGMSDCFWIRLQSTHIVIFQRTNFWSFQGKVVIITIKDINDQLDEWLIQTYEQTKESLLNTTPIIDNGIKALDNTQHISFFKKIIRILALAVMSVLDVL